MYLLCLKTDKTFGVKKDNTYRITSVSHLDMDYYEIETDIGKIGFMSTTKLFDLISVREMRKLKMDRVLK